MKNQKTIKKIISVLILTGACLVGCEQSPPPKHVAQSNNSQEKPEEKKEQPSSQPQQNGMMNTLAHAAVGGAAAGAAGAASHAATNHAIQSFKKRRRAKRIMKMRSRRR